MLELMLWHTGQLHSSLDSHVLEDYRKQPLAKVMHASPVLVRRIAESLRRLPSLRPSDLSQLWTAIEVAGERIATSTIGGVSPEAHAEAVTRATGLPIHWSRNGLKELGERMCGIKTALARQSPNGNVKAFLDQEVEQPSGGDPLAWVPTGRVLGVIESSNAATTQLAWVLALAMGWTVLLRPGKSDPLTSYRVFSALKEAGFPAERLAILPGEHDLVTAMRDAADRLIAYGGSALAKVLGSRSTIAFNGPGNSKVFVDGMAASGELSDFLFDCITSAGGRKCVCTSAIAFRNSDPEIAHELRGRLSSMALLDPMDPAARVPAWKEGERTVAPPAVIARHDGVDFLKPDLVMCERPQAPFGMELPGPWATAVNVSNDTDLVSVFKPALALTLLSTDEELRKRCLIEPSIQKVFCGPIPTWHNVPGAPHGGRISDLLFTHKPAWRRQLSFPQSSVRS